MSRTGYVALQLRYVTAARHEPKCSFLPTNENNYEIAYYIGMEQNTRGRVCLANTAITSTNVLVCSIFSKGTPRIQFYEFFPCIARILRVKSVEESKFYRFLLWNLDTRFEFFSMRYKL